MFTFAETYLLIKLAEVFSSKNRLLEEIVNALLKDC